MKLVGYVSGGEDISPYEFLVRIRNDLQEPPSTMVRIGDIVRVDFEYENLGKVTVYGVVSELKNQWDRSGITGYEEILMIERGAKLTLRTFLAKVVTTRVISDKDKFTPPSVPPVPGSKVYLVEDEEEVDIAMGFDEIKKKGKALPVGILENGAVAYVDMDYIFGENGAHINISGQSGVAAKTSYMTFLMRSIIDTVKREESWRNSARPKFIIFNVKGQSLMFIDKPSRRWSSLKDSELGKFWQDMYKRMNIEPKPFENVRFYAVAKTSISEEPDSDRKKGVSVYWWNTKDFFELGLFEMIFDPSELSRNENLMLGVIGIEDFMAFKNYKANINSPFELLNRLRDEGSKLREYLTDEVGLRESTIRMLERRIKLAVGMGLDKLWRGGEGGRIEWDKPDVDVTVVDISRLRTRMQALVVGAVLRDVMRKKESGEFSTSVPVFIMVDELNKYAPRNERNEIAAIFRDVAERGRSFGVILVGAEQTASEVDYRVITQAATVIVGRQKWAELTKNEYGHLLPEQKRRATTLTQGEVIVDQPFLRVPMVVRFPLPAWSVAGKEDEMVDTSEFEDLE